MYKNGIIEAIYHAEGRVTTINGSLKYEYAFKDHLGNTRLMFCDKNGDGLITQAADQEASEVTQENHFYPFGLNMEGAWSNTPSITDNKYQYNGKELVSDFGLEWNDYGARFYDPAIGRWHSVDPMAEKTSNYSPYNFVDNNPIVKIDQNGKYAVAVHYHITYDVLKELGYSNEEADIIAHYGSTYADHPSRNIMVFEQDLHPTDIKNIGYRENLDYSRTEESQDEKNSKWHGMMSDAKAAGGMTEQQAIDRGLKFGWDNIFDYSKEEKGSGDLGKLGQALHAFQDVIAHGGVKTSDHLGGKNLKSMASSIGKTLNDEFGSTKEARAFTKSAMIVVNVLQGNKVQLKVGDKISLSGMSNDQKKEVLSKLKTQGYILKDN